MHGALETALRGPHADAGRLAALWSWLASWITPDGGVNGPVVHRGDLKRMLAIHDTPWTQEAVIGGLLELYRRSGHEGWLARALRLGDAQCARQRADGAFRWAGHEDDRFSALVHNALADCALLDLADALRDRDDAVRRERYVAVAERNLEEYVIGVLFRPDLQGFAMNPIDYYAGRDRFVVNMNAVAVEALIKLDRQRGRDGHARLVRAVGERIRSLQSREGPAAGGLPYSDLEPDTHVPLYTAVALRGVVALAAATGEPAWAELTRAAVASLGRLEDPETGLWWHKLDARRVHRFPLFVAGAGLIGNGLLDAAALTGTSFDGPALAGRLLRFQYRHGAIRNFIGYDHPDNGRPRGHGTDCWEDVYPTPSWNAQAFRFLCRVLPAPPAAAPHSARPEGRWSPRYVYVDTRRLSLVAGPWPLRSAMLAVFLKRRRHGLVVPGPHMIVRALVSLVARAGWGRAALRRLRDRP
jgi:hypothetical protein